MHMHESTMMTAVSKVKQLTEVHMHRARTPFAVCVMWSHRLQRAEHLADNAEKYIFIKLRCYENSNEHFHVGGYFSEVPVKYFFLAPVSSIFICHL